MPSLPGRRPQMSAEQVQELAGRVRPRLERRREIGDPVVVLDEFLLAGERVVDAVDAFFGERGVVGMRRSDVVVLAARLVEVVVQVRAGRDQAVHVPVGDQVGDDQPQPAGAERARHAEKDRDVVFEHLAPDAVRRRRGSAPETKSAPSAPESGPR